MLLVFETFVKCGFICKVLIISLLVSNRAKLLLKGKFVGNTIFVIHLTHCFFPKFVKLRHNFNYTDMTLEYVIQLTVNHIFLKYLVILQDKLASSYYDLIRKKLLL